MAHFIALRRLYRIFRSSINMETESKTSREHDDDEDDIIPKICPECISTLVASDPSTLKGQQEGAILVIKSITGTGDFQPQVGDYVKLLRVDTEQYVTVKNLRGSNIGLIPWSNFFPVPYFGKCDCTRSRCRCIYESAEEFHVRSQPPSSLA